MTAIDFKNWIDSCMAAEDLPEATPLHHYTSAAVLEKILQTKEFHFTDAFHQNDPVQIEYGIGLAREIYQQENFVEWIDGLNRHDLFHFFVGCFSRDENKLDLWRFYGEDGKGFRITFHPNSFEHAQIDLFAKDCKYVDDETKQRHRAAVQNAVQHLPPQFDIEEMDQIKALLFSRVLWNSIFSKPEDYKSENEVRLVVAGDKEKIQKLNLVKCRVKGNSLIPFIPLKLKDKGAIIEIMAGPAAAETAEENVKHLLRQHGWGTKISVTRSKIHYRPPERI